MHREVVCRRKFSFVAWPHDERRLFEKRTSLVCDLVKVGGLAFPDYQHTPSQISQRGFVPLVPTYVAVQLVQPEVSAGLRQLVP